ncbi:MAG: GNAT family N-acetyltransferase [Syntrophomonadaceae bacterium]|nr:GNAT family N-acetyltransferase [Syntrophomonadaceae bacterium]
MDIVIDAYGEKDLAEMISIWNEIVEEGIAFPQLELLTIDSGKEFFDQQDFVGVAKCDDKVAGLYILHPNNVGRCGHQANTGYAVDSNMRGLKIGESLVRHSLQKAKELGYKLMILNAVVRDNESAIHIYNKLGFIKLGIVPQGFLLKTGEYQDTIVFYRELK